MKKLCLLPCLILSAALLWSQPVKVLFPGDSNNDGFCNHYDLLPMGILYGRLGEPRDLQSLDWMPQLFVSWPDSLPVSHVDAGFSDADGNGVIDEDDLRVFKRNYDSLQQTSVPPPESWLGKLSDTLFSSAPPIFELVFDRDTAFPADTIFAVIRYQVSDRHPTQVGGVALWLSYEPGLVREESIRWLPDTTRDDVMYLAATPQRVDFWKVIPPGNIQLAAVGKGQNAFKGNGVLASIRFIIEDKILASQIPFSLECREFLAMNMDEQIIPAIFQKDTVLLKRRTSRSRDPDMGRHDVRIFPNPAEGSFFVQTPGEANLIALHAAAGQVVRTWKKSFWQTMPISMEGLPAGVYWLQLEISGENIWRKIVHR